MKTLTITASQGGTTVPPPGTHEYVDGSVVQGITAQAEPGYWFNRWLLDGLDYTSSSTVSVLMDTDHTLYAEFAGLPPPPAQHTLTILAATGGITTPEAGQYTYDAGTLVDVDEMPNQGWAFDGWLLDDVRHDDLPIQVLMDSDHTVQVLFKQGEGPGPSSGPDYTVPAIVAGATISLAAIAAGAYYFFVIQGGV